MKQELYHDPHHRMLRHVATLPRKIVSLHGVENVTEFVLHDLCHNCCFNLDKAAYFVDNPDFDCFKGVAGFDDEQAYHDNDIWRDVNGFSNHMKRAPFNQQIRAFEHASAHLNQSPTSTIVAQLASLFSFTEPHFMTFDMKHDNTGLLIYQKNDHNHVSTNEDIINGLSLLSFCPIF